MVITSIHLYPASLPWSYENLTTYAEKVNHAMPFLKKGIDEDELGKIIDVPPKKMGNFITHLTQNGHLIIRHQDMIRIQRPGDFDKY